MFLLLGHNYIKYYIAVYLIMDRTVIKIYTSNTSSEQALPYADAGIRAGFPSPAQDCLQESIDLNKELVRHPATTFYARVVGDSMKDDGINDGDIIVIDKGIEPQDNDIVVAFVDGEFTLKRIKLDQSNKFLWLMPANEKYEPIRINEDNEFIIWGVVTYSIKKQLNRK